MSPVLKIFTIPPKHQFFQAYLLFGSQSVFEVCNPEVTKTGDGACQFLVENMSDRQVKHKSKNTSQFKQVVQTLWVPSHHPFQSEGLKHYM